MGRLRALLVGINRYPNLPATTQLAYAGDDVSAVARVLIDQYGYQRADVQVLMNESATKAGIEGAMSRLADPGVVREDDQVLIFFAGHGQTVPLPREGEMGFLIPYDAKVRLEDPRNPAPYLRTCLPMSRIKELGSLIRARHVLFLVDACYSGLAAMAPRGAKVESRSGAALDSAARLPSRQIITGGRRGEQVMESSEWGHSAMVHVLLAGLRDRAADENGDGTVTATELATYISGRVPRIAKQTPQFRCLDDGEGEFLFTPAR